MLRELIPGRSERLFARFRARGDAAALGRVFDRCAPELFGLALRLAPAPELAQDLVQATFLTAIESAGRWDARRPLVPWLIGILVREARMLRRRERRALDPERIEPRPARDPSRLAEDEEFARALRSALEVLPAKYREVLHAHLYAEKPAAEIAAELGREPGTVRVQIHRGLELLRKALPAGLALGGALVGSPRALAAVRERVLARAAGHGAGAGIGPVLVGGIVVKKLGLGALAAFLIGAVVWLARSPHERIPSVAAEGEGAPSVARVETSPADGLARVSPATSAAAREPSRAAEGVEPPAPEPGRSGIRGRLVEHDGTPVPGTSVALTGIPRELFVVDAFAALEGAPRAPELALASARTDAGGFFTIQGVPRSAVHALAIDPLGPRATLRVLEEGLHLGETTDVGDIVLAATGTIAGRVVDESGRPLAGVRVRIAELPETVLELELHRLRASSLIVGRARRDEPLAALEIPAWASELLERLPIPTATTAEDGAFELRSPLGVELTLVADAPGFEPRVLAGLRLAPDASFDTGALTLRAGRALVCRVRDASGKPLEGAEVFAGALVERESFAVCERAEPAGEPGLYRLAGASAGPAVFAVRAGGSTWFAAGPFDGAGTQDVRLGELRTLVLDARDERGRGVEGLRLALQPADLLARTHETAFLVLPQPVEAARTDATTFAVSGLAEGRYNLFARADGCAALRAEVEVRGPTPVARLVFREGGTFLVRVRDAASRAVLPWVGVSLFTGSQGRNARIAFARTDGEGCVRFGRVTTADQEPSFVRAEHEGYAVAGALIEEGVRELELGLARPASVVGRVHEDGRAPARRYLVALQPRAEALRSPLNVPFHALTDAAGRFRIADLPPGEFRYQVGERFLEGDPLLGLLGGRLGRSFDADKGILERRLRQGHLALAAGEDALLEIDLAAEVGPAAATLRGRIVRDGRGWPGVELELRAGTAELERTSDERGGFDFGRVPAGAARLVVEDVARDRTVLRAELELALGEERVLELVLDPLTLDLCLVGTSGPLAGAELTLWPQSSLYEEEPITARTDGAGRCRVTLPGCARYAWSADAGGAKASGEVDVLGSEPLVLTLRPPDR